MLKALELVGFKSFADKTRLEFPPGITVVVGPNGSGKSNIVDAIKWVLGEQSAKSLRGKDMADVIFKGMGGAGRKPMNTAEATLIIDNADRLLPIDAPEVHVTRRVYRSGEGEYLINRQPCRLKDIRDMFRGTGVGTDAYSIIEQGKVDRLLQASAKDRRAIFEEAAGISRFKAKKVEAQRRLERVEQNLLRLSDIVEEVENRLKSVRSQAVKARRYKEYSDRLQQLRTQVGLADWRRLSEHLAALEAELAELGNTTVAATAEADQLESRGAELEQELAEISEATRTSEARFARVREALAANDSSVEHLHARGLELDEEQARRRGQLAEFTARAGELAQQFAETRETVAKATAVHEGIQHTVDEHEAACEEMSSRLAELRTDNERRRSDYLARMRSAAGLGNRASTYQSELAAAESASHRLRRQVDDLDAQCARQAGELAQHEAADERLAREQAARQRELETARQQLLETRRDYTLKQEELSQLRERHTGAAQRAELLEELERRLEGLTTGVKEVLAKARQNQDGAFREVRGLVADLIQVNVETAPLVDLALGERAQYLVLAGDQLLQRIQTGEYRVGGRVAFIRLEPPPNLRPTDRVDLSDAEGVVGRADRLVRCAPEYERLVKRLLADTWFVETLSHAVALSQQHPNGPRFVTLAGQMVDSDHSIVVGPRQKTSGLISRRSELRALQEEIAELDGKLAAVEGELAALGHTIQRQDSTASQLAQADQRTQQQLADTRARLAAVHQALEQCEKQRTAATAELHAATARRESLANDLHAAQEQLKAVEHEILQLESTVRKTDQIIAELETQRQARTRVATAAKVELAKSEQRIESLSARLTQLERDQAERIEATAQLRERLRQSRQRFDETQRGILKASSEAAELYLLKEGLADTTAELLGQQHELSTERGGLASQLQKCRSTLRKAEDRQHQLALNAGQLRHERSGLAERLREDYGIDISQVQEGETAESTQRQEIEDEIASLRKKLASVGAVNMESLDEIEELENRFGALSGQYKDLVGAKESLERIIQRINADSRRLFAETLEAIRANFQVLYRKSFGGGKADIILEPGVDILDAGIEILATPPGKPEFNNSLLSGGEKALTAVSLLMAIFQFRPSPFCVLDEVDAPFDEANVGRFVDVLKEFLAWTRFVIVTHSKKTMTAANTLYGVTMQESGVSKKVSVQFDDVSEDGQISAAAISREADDAA